MITEKMNSNKLDITVPEKLEVSCDIVFIFPRGFRKIKPVPRLHKLLKPSYS
jgi:hypothetical protein